MSTDYLPRIADTELQTLLGALGAVLIEGPKACGKTETASQLAASVVRLDTDENARQAIAVDPGLILEGDTPRLIDEWQVETDIWNHVRRAVDDRREPGQFILTGSAVPADDDTRHTGAGRFARMRMRPLSLYESSLSNGAISLAALLNGETSSAADPGLDVADLTEAIARGGWPANHGIELAAALIRNRGYIDEVRNTDINRVDDRSRDPERVERVLRSLARHVGTAAAAAVIAADTGGAEGPIKDETVADYLEALRRLFVVEDQPAWAPHLRSRYQLRRAAKRHFVCPSIAVAALRTSPAPLLKDLNYLGFLFESLVVRDLRIYAQANDAQVLQYRDSNNHEADAIVAGADGRWAAFEIKLGVGQVDDAADSLQRFIKQVDTSKVGEPAALGVIAGTGYGYTREDGIQVIPIGALGP